MEIFVFIAIPAILVCVAIARVFRQIKLRNNRRNDPYRKVLFLDFDGVLHRGFSETFEHLGAFEKLLRSHLDTSVVISSDWRRGKTLDQLKSLFSSSAREQIVGVTPELSPDDRQREIEAFCEMHKIGSYLIIDDSKALFRPGNSNAYFTNPKTGLTRDDLYCIDAWLRKA